MSLEEKELDLESLAKLLVFVKLKDEKEGKPDGNRDGRPAAGCDGSGC